MSLAKGSAVRLLIAIVIDWRFALAVAAALLGWLLLK